MKELIRNLLLPAYLNCKICRIYIYEQFWNEGDCYYWCKSCQLFTKWNNYTSLCSIKIKLPILETIIYMFVNLKSAKDTLDFLKMDFTQLNIKTVRRFYKLLGKICHYYYSLYLSNAQLKGHVEVDETHLYKEKKTSAFHRSYSTKSVWLFGMRNRDKSSFIILPVYCRNKETLIPIIEKYIKKGSTIYSDSFSVYVNNYTKPKSSHLTSLGYAHYFGNHSYEFVSDFFPEINTNYIENLWWSLKNFTKKNKFYKL